LHSIYDFFQVLSPAEANISIRTSEYELHKSRL
jgi:hypothetical protein